MEKAITTILLTVASVVALLVVVNSTLPIVHRTGSAVTGSAAALDDRLKSKIEIIHATGQPDTPTVYIWVKNVGTSTLPSVAKTDIFFGPATNFTRIPYGGSNCSAPCWEYTIENASTWEPTATVRITLHLSRTLQTGTTYYVKVVVYNGVSDARFFTL